MDGARPGSGHSQPSSTPSLWVPLRYWVAAQISFLTVLFWAPFGTTELTGELHNAIVGFLSLAPSKLMLLNQEDLLKETEQQNLPGSTAEYPNWRRKMRCTIEELWSSEEVQAFAGMYRSWLERTGRLNSALAAAPAPYIK